MNTRGQEIKTIRSRRVEPSRLRRHSSSQSISDKENIEPEVYSDEERDVPQLLVVNRTSLQSVTANVTVNVLADVEKTRADLDKAKAQITELDREYRSRKDPLRSELYIGLKRFFNVYPASHFRMFLNDMPDERFDAFMEPRPVFAKLQTWDWKHKIQRTLRYMEFQNMDNRTMLYTTAGTLNLVYAAKFSSRLEWTSYRLLDRRDFADVLDKRSNREFGISVKDNISEAIERVEDSIALEGGSNGVTLFFVHRKAEGEYTYLGIRRQSAPTPDERNNKRKTKKRAKGRTQQVKETAKTLTIMIKQGCPYFFTNGAIAENETVFKVLVKALGYKGYIEQNLKGKSVTSLINTCTTNHEAVSLQDIEKGFRAEEDEMATEGIFWGSRRTELDRQHQMASFFGMDKENSNVITNDRKKSEMKTIQFTSKLGKTTMKMKGTQREADAYIIACYKLGYITDLTPFINLKKERSNQCHIEDDE